MTNPLTMWSSCGIYTNLPYGYEPGYKGRLPDESSRSISNRKGLEYDDYYYYDYYYDDEEDVYDRVEDRVDTNSEFSEASILDNVLDIVLNRKKNKPRPNVIFQRPGLSQRPRLPPLVPDRIKAFQEDIQEKSDGIFSNLAENISGAIGRLVSSVGFFGILLPGILAGLLYLGVPVAQSMFAGASLITTFLLSTEARESLLSPVSLDAAARFILISVLKILQGLSDGKESRISDNFPFCINGTQIEKTIADNGCRGDFLLSSLHPHQGILETSLTSLGDNMTVCREGSLPDIVFKIARQVVTVVGDCE